MKTINLRDINSPNLPCLCSQCFHPRIDQVGWEIREEISSFLVGPVRGQLIEQIEAEAVGK